MVVSLERMNRILEIDEDNLVAVVEPERRSPATCRTRWSARPVLSARPRVAQSVDLAATSPSAPAARAPSSTA